MLWCIWWCAIVLQTDIPYKDAGEFTAELKYEFKQRSGGDPYTVNFTDTQKDLERKSSNAMLPYLVVHLTLTRLQPNEVRVRAEDNLRKTLFQKKAEIGQVIKIDMGFTDDVKDRVTAHDFVVLLLSADRKPTSRIRLWVEEDGTFFINDEKRGKF